LLPEKNGFWGKLKLRKIVLCFLTHHAMLFFTILSNNKKANQNEMHTYLYHFPSNIYKGRNKG